MPTIVFRVNLETLQAQGFSQPFTSAEAANFKLTRATWIPDTLRNNRELKHGDEFEVSGANALYLKNNYTTGAYKCLDVVSET